MSKLPTLEEMLESQSKWWEERVEQVQQNSGHNILDPALTAVRLDGAEQDITFLLRYVRTLTEKLIAARGITELGSDGEKTTTKPNLNKESQ